MIKERGKDNIKEICKPSSVASSEILIVKSEREIIEDQSLTEEKPFLFRKQTYELHI